MWSDRNLFFNKIKFCKPGVIQDFSLIFSFYLLVFLKFSKLSDNLLVLCRNISVEQSVFCSYIFSVSFQLIEK